MAMKSGKSSRATTVNTPRMVVSNGQKFHLMRLEKTQTWIAAGITITLFAGLLLLDQALPEPRWWQFAWTIVCMAAWLRCVIVIMRKEKLVNDSWNSDSCDERARGGIRMAEGAEEPKVLPDHLDGRVDTRPVSRR
jgi:hypothetical protein